MEQDVPVRVTRGHESSSSYSGKVYTYDGLYKVISWALFVLFIYFLEEQWNVYNVAREWLVCLRFRWVMWNSILEIK